MVPLFHCFGAKPSHRVDTRMAANMLRASGCTYLAVNTHRIGEVGSGDQLPVGYGSATLGSVRDCVGAELGLQPVLNINHPTTAVEAVERTRHAVELTGIRVIKLEVLDPGLTISSNDEVVAAARALLAEGLEVWPLITPDKLVFEECVAMGATMVRVMGSPIGSCRGISAEWLPVIEDMLADSATPVMLDGGIGSTDDVARAFQLGFASVLVNSCLFNGSTDPVASLRTFRAIIEDSADVKRTAAH